MWKKNKSILLDFPKTTLYVEKQLSYAFKILKEKIAKPNKTINKFSNIVSNVLLS